MSSVIIAQQVAKPFPQHVIYFPGTIKPSHISQQQMDDSVIAFYNAWKQRYIKDAGEGQYYVWSEQRKNNCVSEGQGYGMMITALMAGYDSTAQKTYNGLFKYYRAHPSTKDPYLMAWQQDKHFKSIEGSSAADGDMDIAYALLLADAQWGSNGDINYLKEALLVINAVAVQEINQTTFSVLLSDAVENDSKDYFDMRSSDFMPAHFKAFKKYGDSSLWNKVINNNYKLFAALQNSYSPDAGLVPDFIQNINTAPIPAGANYLESKYDGDYYYNACRVPWRIGTDHILNGDKRSKEFLKKITGWLLKKTNGDPKLISAGYYLDGKELKRKDNDALAFTAPFAVAAMADKKYQPWLNKIWDHIETSGIGDYKYYENTIKMICLIILSGNYWQP